jgi:glycosyltransferase involved in cell wall biosynthesis
MLVGWDVKRLEKLKEKHYSNILYLSRELVKLGAVVHIICPSKNRRQKEVIEGVEIHRIKRFYRLNVLRKIRELNCVSPIDLIYVEAVTMRNLPFLFLRNIICNKPLVLRLPYSRLAEYTVNKLYPDLGLPLSYRIKRLAILFKDTFKELISCENADMIITPSIASAKDIARVFSFTKDKLVVVPNGVDVSIFKKNKDTEIKTKFSLEDRHIILYVGNLGPRKGLPYLIKAISNIINYFEDFLVLIIGGHVKSFEGKFLRKLIQRSKLENHFKMIGKISHTVLPYYYSIADIFAFPSLYDALPKVLLEAMACGLPVVAFRGSSIPEVVSNLNEGITVTTKNSDAFGSALLYLLKNPNNAREMGLKGIKRVNKEFRWELVSKRMLEYFEKLISNQMWAERDFSQ